MLALIYGRQAVQKKTVTIDRAYFARDFLLNTWFPLYPQEWGRGC